MPKETSTYLEQRAIHGIPRFHEDHLFTADDVHLYFGVPKAAIRAALKNGTIDYLVFATTGARLMRLEAIREWLVDVQHATMKTHDQRIERYRAVRKAPKRKPIGYRYVATKNGGQLKVPVWSEDDPHYKAAMLKEQKSIDEEQRRLGNAPGSYVPEVPITRRLRDQILAPEPPGLPDLDALDGDDEDG